MLHRGIEMQESPAWLSTGMPMAIGGDTLPAHKAVPIAARSLMIRQVRDAFKTIAAKAAVEYRSTIEGVKGSLCALRILNPWSSIARSL